jgi:hypothetical protein
VTADRLPDEVEQQVSRVHAKDGCECISQGVGPCCEEVRGDLRRAIAAALEALRGGKE